MEKFKKHLIDWKNDSQEELDWKIKNKDKAFDLFCELYDTSYGSLFIEDNLIEIHTGGWSENEELLYYLKNSFWWFNKYVITSSGGHFYIDLDSMNDVKKHWKIIKD